MLAEKKEEKLSDRLNFFTLGRFEINRSDKGTYNPSGRTTKLWDLFKYLLAHQGKGIAPEIILENLYPDEVYENPKNTLQNLIYRLRKLLKEEDFFTGYDCNILFSNGCYSLCLSDNMCLDTELFEIYIKKAESYRNSNPEEAIMFYEKAIDVYGGDFFPELVYEDWVIPKRNYYRRVYIQSLLQLFSLYKQKKTYERSIKVFEKAIQVEPYEEELHICFIESLFLKGKRKEALKHYEYITGVLYKQFGIKPTAEMQKVYQLLKKNCISKENINQYLENDTACGAFYCDINIFRSIFLLEKRRSERTGNVVFPVSVSPDDNVLHSAQVMERFREALISSLRKGDVVTNWDDTHLLVLLPNTEYKQVMMVMNRIIKQYQIGHENNIKFKIKAYSLLPGSNN